MTMAIFCTRKCSQGGNGYGTHIQERFAFFINSVQILIIGFCRRFRFPLKEIQINTDFNQGFFGKAYLVNVL